MNASKNEVSAISAVSSLKKRISIKSVIESALEYSGKLPSVISGILNDRLFYLSSTKKAKGEDNNGE